MSALRAPERPLTVFFTNRTLATQKLRLSQFRAADTRLAPNMFVDAVKCEDNQTPNGFNKYRWHEEPMSLICWRSLSTTRIHSLWEPENSDMICNFLSIQCTMHMPAVLTHIYVTTGIIPQNGVRIPRINACYSIANFNFNLTLIHCSN